MNKLCVISTSGGLDSTTLCMKAIEEGYTILPINIKYGQKNVVELKAFEEVKEFFTRNFEEQFLSPVYLDLESMLETSLALYQRIRDSGEVEDTTDMEFYTPSRNLVFSTLAAMIGEIAAIAGGRTEIKIGLGIHKHTEYDRDYWDIKPEFVDALDKVFSLNDCIDVSMYAPYANSEKSEIVKDALRLGVPYEKTWTCYDPQQHTIGDQIPGTAIVEYTPCLKCEACIEREKAGQAAGVNNINNYSQQGTIKI